MKSTARPSVSACCDSAFCSARLMTMIWSILLKYSEGSERRKPSSPRSNSVSCGKESAQVENKTVLVPGRLGLSPRTGRLIWIPLKRQIRAFEPGMNDLGPKPCPR